MWGITKHSFYGIFRSGVQNQYNFFIDLSINKENRWQSWLDCPCFRASVSCLVKQVKSFSQPYIYVEDQPTFPTAMLCLDNFLMLLNRLNQDKVWQWKHFWLDLVIMNIIFDRKWINQSNQTNRPVRYGSKFLEVWLNNHDNCASNFRNTALQ